MTSGLALVVPAPVSRPHAGVPVIGQVVPQTPLVTQARPQQGAKLLTGPDGLLRSPEETRRYCAIFDDGSYYISGNYETHPLVAGAVSVANLHGIQLREQKQISSESLSRLYLEHGTTTARVSADETSELIQQLVNLVADAVDQRASDIHIRVFRATTKVLFRVDGRIRLAKSLNPDDGRKLAHIVYTQCAVKDRDFTNNGPQNGQIQGGPGTPYPPQIDTIRTLHLPLMDNGVNVSLRLLNVPGEQEITNLVDAGFLPFQAEILEDLVDLPEGIIVASGPTGHGKSTTIKIILAGAMERSHESRNGYTVEDPPEYIIPGFAQVVIKNAKTEAEKADAFGLVNEALLRADPDIIMPPEMRGAPSAHAAFLAATSGHLVVVSVHANSSAEILDRGRSFGVERYLLYNHKLVRGLIAQRLIPILCPHCRVTRGKVAYTLKPQLRKRIERIGQSVFARGKDGNLPEMRFRNPEGCRRCEGSGLRGRRLFGEVIVPSIEFMALMRDEKVADAVHHWRAKEGGVTIMDHAISAMVRGALDPFELELKCGHMPDNFKDVYDPEGLAQPFPFARVSMGVQETSYGSDVPFEAAA